MTFALRPVHFVSIGNRNIANAMQPPLIKPSTRAFYRACRKRGMSLFQFVHGYVYGRWCFHYIGLAGDKNPWWRWLWAPFIVLIDRLTPFRSTPDNPIGDPAQKKPVWGDTYHGKAMPVTEAARLVKIDRPVNTKVSEQVLPYTRAREIVLRAPARIVVMDCPCRSGMKNPCLPLDVCLIVGDPIASFILEHHPDKSREITADEAVRILKAEHARGHVTHAFFKDVMLGRFYAICNCCACCCRAMQAQRMGIEMLCSSGYLAQTDADKCVGCGNCATKCPFDAIAVRDRLAVIDTAKCMGCGVCVDACPKEALSLRPAPEKGEPLRVDRL